MKSNIWTIILLLGVVVLAADAASALRGNSMKQERKEIQHTLEEKNIDQTLTDSKQFVNAELASLKTSKNCSSYTKKTNCI